MEVKATSIELSKVQADAEESFRKGFYCCEAVMDVIIDHFKVDVPREVIGMASGMSVGVGKSGCICGALNGGVLALGMLFGRSEHPDKRVQDGRRPAQVTVHLLHRYVRSQDS